MDRIGQRILVIGGCGSGKTTFAKKLAERTGLPLCHLDRLYWRGNWDHRPREEFDPMLDEILREPRWIIDGNFLRTLPRRLEVADTVIWFDFPGILCLRGVLERFFKYYGKSRDDMGGDCVERLDLEKLRFFHTTLWMNRRNRPKLRAALADAPHVRLTVFHTRREADRYLDSIKKEG